MLGVLKGRRRATLGLMTLHGRGLNQSDRAHPLRLTKMSSKLKVFMFRADSNLLHHSLR